jgi:hypothetical protein
MDNATTADGEADRLADYRKTHSIEHVVLERRWITLQLLERNLGSPPPPYQPRSYRSPQASAIQAQRDPIL